MTLADIVPSEFVPLLVGIICDLACMMLNPIRPQKTKYGILTPFKGFAIKGKALQARHWSKRVNTMPRMTPDGLSILLVNYFTK